VTTGTYISGGGHALLILWLLLGGLFSGDREPPELESADVSLISAAEFAALSAPQVSPDASVEVPVPAVPEVDASPVPAPRPVTTPDQSGAPETATPDAPDATPETPETPTPPTAEVTDQPPDLIAPPAPDVATPDLTAPSDAPQPQDAPRVAPLPVPETPLSPEIADTATPRVSPDAETDQRAEDAPAAAPEEATTEIVTEAETPARAPGASPRPVARPAPPEVAETPTPDAPAVPGEAIADAVAEAVAGAVTDTPAAPAPAAPSGPPLTRGEKDGLRVAVQQCWNTGSLSTEALLVTVTVAVSMARDGTPDSGSIRMIDATGGSAEAARQAFEAARRAIIRCGARGFDLPVEKYDQWRDIEMTFNPERMRIK
jgi:hypothetical protein